MDFVSRPALRWAGLSALVAASLSLGPAAEAASPEVRLRVARKPVRAALIDLALQAEVSLGGDLDACRGESPTIAGLMALETALSRVLAGSGCTFAILDQRTVVVRRALPKLPPAAAYAPRPAPPVVAEAEGEVALGEVVITAQRFPNLPGRTPYAISAVSGEAITRERASSLADIGFQVAGLTTTNLGPGRDKILLRGLSDGAFTGQTQSIVALYLDEVPITYNAPDPDLRLADIERVEVMRGPQGTLYGGGTIGGVVRLATRKPNLDEISGQVLAGASATRHGGVGGELEGTINLPLLAGKVAMRAVGYVERSPGYIDNAGPARNDVNASERNGARLSLRAVLSPAWQVMAVTNYQVIHNHDTQYGVARLGPLIRDNAVREPHANSFDQYSVTLTGDGDWGRLTASVSQLGHDFSSRYDATSQTALFGLPTGPAAFDDARSTDLVVGEVTYATPSGRRLHGLVGAFFSTTEARFDSAMAPATTGGALGYQEARIDDIREAAVYGEATWDLPWSLSATAGLRWFDYHYGVRSSVTQAGEARAFAGEDGERGVSPKILVSYAPKSSLLVYLQLSEGYRPGGFNTGGRVGQVFGSLGAPQRQYRPDQLWNHEVGVKLKAFDDRLQMRAAAFYAEWDSIQSDQYLADGLGYTVNVGDGDNTGLEVEGAWRASDHFDLSLALLVNNPSLSRLSVDPASVASAGLAGVSSGSANLNIDYHRPLAWGPTLRLRLQAAHTGRARLGLDEATGRHLDSYWTTAASAALETERWTLAAYVDNPFDSQANTFAFGNPFAPRSDQAITPLRPRTTGFRLVSRF
jgi:outer membrane receptor protein involved in Fe transport